MFFLDDNNVPVPMEQIIPSSLIQNIIHNLPTPGKADSDGDQLDHQNQSLTTPDVSLEHSYCSGIADFIENAAQHEQQQLEGAALDEQPYMMDVCATTEVDFEAKPIDVVNECGPEQYCEVDKIIFSSSRDTTPTPSILPKSNMPPKKSVQNHHTGNIKTDVFIKDLDTR